MDLLTRVSSLRRRSTANASLYEPRDIYYLYKDEFGFAPKKANHLIQFAKRKDYVLKFIKAEELLKHPPHAPKRRLSNGDYEWSGSDATSSADDDRKSLSSMEDAMDKKKKKKEKKKKRMRIAMNADFDKMKKTQIIVIDDLPDISEMSKFDVNDIININMKETLLYDDCGYYLLPFTDHIVLNFHLDIGMKQWPKLSRMFLGAMDDALGIKRRDYNILSITQHEQEKLESRISVLVRRFNSKWPNYWHEMDVFRRKIDATLSPLKRTFKDSHHLLKMLKKLQFAEIDTGGNNQIDKTEFNAYFNANSVEPLDAQVLNNLYTTMDADGDGEITALEFFKWKTTFSANKLTSMFPIVNYTLCDAYANCNIPRLKAALFQLKRHCSKRLQDFPFELDIKHLFYVSHYDKYEKYQSFGGFQQSKLLFLVHKMGVGDHDLNTLLKSAIGKKGKYFDASGMYGQGYYLTSHLQYALNDIFFNETSPFALDEGHDGLEAPGAHHKVQLSSMDQSQSLDTSHGEYTVMLCLVNPGKIKYIKDFHRSKKIKSADSNCIQRIIGDWNNMESFGRPEPDIYYEGNVYDCFVIKNHERILPRYVVTLRRTKKCFIWIDDTDDLNHESIEESANKLIGARQRFQKFMPSVIYAGNNIQRVIKTVRLKMQYNSVFLLRFVGVDVNVNSTMTAFINYIAGNIKNIAIRIYPITILFNVNSRKQLWNLILRDYKNKRFSNVSGSSKQIFKYIRDNLGGNRGIKTMYRSSNTHISVIVMSIKFIKSDGEIKDVMKQQMEDALRLEKEFKDNPSYDVPMDADADADAGVDVDIDDEARDINRKSFKIEITGAAADAVDILENESISKLLQLDLPPQVSEYLGSPKTYKLPSADPESMQTLERDMKKMQQGLHDQSVNQRKYSKLAILKYYDALCAVYDKYCRLGGDRHWLTLDGFTWMIHDAMISDKDDNLQQLFQITYKMHHRLQSRHKSKHNMQLSGMYGDVSFHDDDPWSGIWSEMDRDSSQIYKLRKIGDLRLSGCINSVSYAHISGGYHSLNYKKAELEIKYHQRTRAGIVRIWNAELIAPTHMMDPISMNVEWKEINTKHKGKLLLKKTDKLSDHDKDLPKDQMIGLSRHEFFDLMLSVATTTFGIDYEYQFICIEKLLSQHICAYLYQNIVNNTLYSIVNNERVKKEIRSKSHGLRKLFKYYASLDTGDAADDDGLGIEEWCTFALEICKTMKSLNKKIWKNGGQPSFEDMKAAFILSKAGHALDEEELDYIHFERCVVNLVNVMFKTQPNTKYDILPFHDKLNIMLNACEKLNKTRTNTNIITNRDSEIFKKLKSSNILFTPKTPT